MSSPKAPTSDQLRLLVDAQSDYAIFLLDPTGRIATWNRGAERLKGWRAGEIIGRHFSIFYTQPDRDRDHPAEELEIAIREGRFEEEGWRVRKDGSRFWANVVITALRDERGDLVGFGKVTRDLTSRRLAEEQLRSNARDLATANAELEQFRLLVANVRDYSIFMLDAGGHVRTWNPGAEHISGYTEDEITGQHFSIFYPAEGREKNLPNLELEIAAREGRYEEEGWRVRKDGARFWAGVVVTPLRNDHGTLIGFAKVVRDLTERRRSDELLRESARELRRSNAELERFASVAAHDLVEPLQTIAGFAELVQRRYGEALDDDGRMFLDQIAAGAGRMRGMVDGLLRYARASQQELRLGPVRLADAVAHVEAALRSSVEARGATIAYDPAALPVVVADPDLLASVLQNLVANAVKFGDEQAPYVEISAGPDTEEGEMWRITVADNGIGVPPEMQAHIFALFGRAHAADAYPGTGLGLALCRRLVERLGGAIGVESAPGAGSRFWFTLAHAGHGDRAVGLVEDRRTSCT